MEGPDKIGDQDKVRRDGTDDADALLRTAAHDMQGPLAVVKGMAELVLLDLAEGKHDSLVENLELIRDAAFKLSTLLRELLEVKAIERGEYALQYQHCDLRALLEEASRRLVPASELRRIGVSIAATPDLTCHVDPNRLGQALDYLLLEASKSAGDGEQLEIAARPLESGEVEICLASSRVGLRREGASQHATPLHLRRDRGPLAKAGLGIAIAKMIIDLHGGRIWVETEKGRGSRFVFTVRRPGEGS